MRTDTFMTARTFLGKVRDSAQRIEVLNRSIEYKNELGEDAGDMPEMLKAEEMRLAQNRVSIMHEIRNLPDVDSQLVLMKRYVELATWEQIAADMDVGIREVQKIHGRALPVLDEMLEEKMF